EPSELVAGDGAYRNAGRLAEFDDFLDARVAAPAGHGNIVKSAPAPSQRFLDGMDSKDGLHELVDWKQSGFKVFQEAAASASLSDSCVDIARLPQRLKPAIL